ncbi:MAG TPA: efflux transporter outer membrane subunit [Rhizomicrobium sp.]|nr:efflux transporter outer membrane subunit [Rhizomicrobium sp.]
MRAWKAGVSLLVLTALAGCAVGPDFKQSDTPAVARITNQPLPARTSSTDIHGGSQQVFAMQGAVPADWWTLFNSPVLNGLVRDALAANSDLAAARAALRVANANAAMERAAFFPGLSAGFDATRQQTSRTLSPVLNSPIQTFNLYTPQLTISYVPDLFGATRRTVESAEAQAHAQEFALRAAHLTLASNVALAAIQYASLSDQLAAQQKIVASAEQLLVMMQDQLARGAISKAALASQVVVVMQARAQLAALQKQRAQQIDLLAALTGRLPADFQPPQLSLADLSLPREAPVSLPADLVRQRPDVRIAEENLHAANAQVGVAIAAMLPNITLSATGGSAATAIGQLFGAGTSFWSIGANVAQTLFDGGALLAKKRAADAALDQAKAQYRSAVTTAFQNTADALEAVHYDSDALVANAAAGAAASEALARARRQQALGDTGMPAVLLAEQSDQQAQIALIQARASRYADTVGLFQALGGGWWNKPELP